MIKEISSYNRFNDLFDIVIESILDSDNEYTKDFQISHVNSINWNKILTDNNIEPHDGLIDVLENNFRHQQPFDLIIDYDRYDSSIRQIYMTDFWISKINNIIENYIENDL